MLTNGKTRKFLNHLQKGLAVFERKKLTVKTKAK